MMEITDFLEDVYAPSRTDLSQDSLHQLRTSVRCFERHLGRPATLADLTEGTLRAFLTAYRRMRSAGTVNSKRCQLLAIWQCAFDEELLACPPRRGKVRRAKESPPIPESWTPEEMGRIIAAAEQETETIGGIPAPLWWRSYLLVLYDSGERRSAALAVPPSDLDLDTQSVVFRSTKTKRPRWCRLAKDTTDACRVIYDPTRDRVWPWKLSRESLDVRLRRILTRSGVKWGPGHGGSLHKVRRTSGTLVEKAGGDGAKHLGNTRAVFKKSYRDPRFFGSTVDLLPRPTGTPHEETSSNALPAGSEDVRGTMAISGGGVHSCHTGGG